MRTYSYATLGLVLALICLGQTSCVVRHDNGHHATVNMQRHDNGRHLGWYKNPNNPHHPVSTNLGNAKSAPVPATAKAKKKPGK